MLKYSTADFRSMPWKNGQGETTELAIAPSGATLDDFDWRVSCAPVLSNGDFSHFRGVNRSLLIRSGAGLVLHVNQQVSFTLTPDSPALPFAGEDAVTATLIDGAIVDFNVMTRRSRFSHDVEVLQCLGASVVYAKGQKLLIYHALGGEIAVAPHLSLSPHELLVTDAAQVQLHSQDAAKIYVVHLFEIR